MTLTGTSFLTPDQVRYRTKRCVTVVCIECNEDYSRRKDSKGKEKLCNPCRTIRKNKPGVDSPAWKGGGSGWVEGRYCTDPQGLHWKEQRILALERDNHCQVTKCFECDTLDVHHIIPYKESMSHALDNLVTLCNSCHMKVESQIKNLEVYPFTEDYPGFDPGREFISTEESPF